MIWEAGGEIRRLPASIETPVEASKALIATHELSPSNDFTSGQYIPDAEKFN